ncbi:carbohydrate kinase family protein [Christiangramia crocea]|uniref:Carbohydrate kinase family protein n=1 Tax=Christiangramia crocea TaxID=2904124 RepID=A0A9X1UV17_9FLAO|nr:carbohydrate kinase family protein [Gramella crocea]MCG9970631.1 carbohydrate kinase family protein [Gramella crocea]
MTSKKILVVGELNIDLILNKIQGFPKIGTEIVADSMDFTLGSSSAIMASNISILGVDTTFCGVIGNDNFGDFVLNQLQFKKVDTQFIQRSEKSKTGVTVVMSYDQDRANITYCGAMKDLNKNSIPWSDIQNFHHMHISSYFLQEGIKDDISWIFKKAKESGLSTSLDLQYDPEEKWDFNYKECLPYVDIFLPNEDELLMLTGQENQEVAIGKIKPFSNTIVIKLGKNGSRLINNKSDIKAAPYLNKKYKDAIGAGDSFNAGFIQKFLEGASPEDCLKNGNLMGSLSTTCAGGTTAFSSKEHIEAQIESLLINNNNED